ncbi:hypothetical protein L228DRAFT_66969 [Xylona heveae TC161]|uniref:GPR1/FUN34/YaaH-class plasma membrane protein n=1 Tax=Xylona heveae (strain CBS 132557 / TC161) TaxID=1328760 RepID=A0A165IST6_XYLHT|nr:hypothetical protein L228DRAFT_66969 [Xylona heveae TC161]KZF25335.1 hypothetical protein L228DRAFT_66969 [Xylona heveae TC161]
MSVTRGDPNGQPLEKDYSQTGVCSHHSNEGDPIAAHDATSDTGLGRVPTARSFSISPELFEKIYLSPATAVKGDLRKTFGNPTPLALVGFVLSLTPLSCELMGWRGSGGFGAAGIGSYFFFGGVCMLIGGVLEFILGNTFPFVVFCSYGGFWLTYGATLQPSFNAYGAYSPDTSNPAAGLNAASFNASFAFFLLFMALLSFVFLICALRTNIVFFLIFLFLTPGFALLAAAFWQVANGNVALAGHIQTAGGACLFVVSSCGWYIFFAQMLAALDFPFQIPVGDLSHIIKGASQRAKAGGSTAYSDA